MLQMALYWFETLPVLGMKGAGQTCTMTLPFLEAVDRFLKAMGSNPDLQTIRSNQYMACRARLKSASLDVAEASVVVEKLSGMPWTAEQLAQLQQHVCLKMKVEKEPGANDKNRRALQNFQAFPRYLTSSVWLALLGEYPGLRFERLLLTHETDD